jgi:hypothetical protein
MSKTPDELYEERKKRVMDAVHLEVPDRVPFMPVFNFFLAKYAGISCRDAMYDYDNLAAAAKKAVLDFETDMFNNPFGTVALGPIMEILDCKYLTWPGDGLPADKPYQFVEKEYIRTEEYEGLGIPFHVGRSSLRPL